MENFKTVESIELHSCSLSLLDLFNVQFIAKHNVARASLKL